jgi:hypothetical protein
MATPTLRNIHGKEARKIELIYDFDKETILVKDPGSKVTSNKLQCKQGDLLTFSCDQGTLSLKLEPIDAFKPTMFKTGDPPVEVVRKLKPGEKGMILCGGEFTNKKVATLGAKTVKIKTGDPEYGVTVQT